jgi:hypothetical protein
MANRKQLYYLSDRVLWKLVGQGRSGAQPALDRFEEIKAAGGSPLCFYSEFNDFYVIDENDPEQMRRAISMQDRAKPFPI